MYRIYKITSHPVVDFAAEELKKYLRMMMPREGEIEIAYKPDATEGFRLGLMQDFSLSVDEARDPELDDILHIDTEAEGGIIAGDNPRSVLLAVYRFLTLNGCRWLYPGVDGEIIPIRKVEATKYHRMAACRYRGQCNEGAESQQAMLETIDFSPKIGLNVYMLEFDIPKIYYDWYYNHKDNEKNRESESVSADTVLQWKRVCEAEIAKRGLQFHDMGHGWNAEAFGISSLGGWTSDENNPVPDEARQYLALIGGKRDLFKGVALNTNFCMSNEKARAIVTQTVCDYAEKSSNVDYLHVWLADAQKNHCECDECRKKTPADWYVVLLNDIDRELTRRGLKNRIGAVMYSETAYEPTCEYLLNPDRFLFLLGAITRSYTYSVPKNPKPEKFTPFVLNQSGRPETMEEHVARAQAWRRFAPSPSIAYEYHFWKHQFYAPGVFSFARRLYEDVHSYRDNGFDGIIEDGSQRSFFPNGLSFYVYAATLFDPSLDFDEICRDYLSHAYGEHWQEVAEYLKTMDRLLPQEYVEARHTLRHDFNQFYRPEMVDTLRQVESETRRFQEKFESWNNMPLRTQTVSMRLLPLHCEFCRGLASALMLKAVGKEYEAKAAIEAFEENFGAKELSIERYYDHHLACAAYKAIFNKISEYNQ